MDIIEKLRYFSNGRDFMIQAADKIESQEAKINMLKTIIEKERSKHEAEVSRLKEENESIRQNSVQLETVVALL